MQCARAGCRCPVGASRYEADGQVFCNEKCARVCTDGNCVCTPEDHKG